MNSGDLLNLPKGVKFCAGGAILMILGLFLPWVKISVGAFGVSTPTSAVSGIDMILLAILILAAGIASLYLAYQYLQKKFITILDGYGNIALGAVSILVILIGYLTVSDASAELVSAFGASVSKSPQLGLIITLAGAILMIVGGYFNMKQSQQAIASIPAQPQI